MKIFLQYLIPAVLLFTACKKQDIEPEPVGKPVVGEKGPDKTWQQLINESSFTLFRSALQRAGMTDMLKGSTAYTVLVPGDDAFIAAGWTADRISKASPEELTALLSYHIMPLFIDPAGLENTSGNISTATLSKRMPDGNDTWYSGYTDLLFLGKSGDSLLINGNAESKWGISIPASNGILFPIKHLLTMPQETMWDYISNNPEFSMYKAAVTISDSLYAASYIGINTTMILMSGEGIKQFTLFLPTNAAFEKAGFHNEEDILNYCLRSYPLPYPDYDENFFYQQPTTAMDSILFANGGEVYPTLGIYGNAKGGPVYFSNDLAANASQLSNLLIQPGQLYSNPPVYLSLDFKYDNGNIMLKRHGANQPFVPLKRKDHRVLNGVVHVVDNLFALPN